MFSAPTAAPESATSLCLPLLLQPSLLQTLQPYSSAIPSLSLPLLLLQPSLLQTLQPYSSVIPSLSLLLLLLQPSLLQPLQP